MMKGKISKSIDGKFNIERKIGNPTPTWLSSLKNFISSSMFIMKISEEKINVIKRNLVKNTL